MGSMPPVSTSAIATKNYVCLSLEHLRSKGILPVRPQRPCGLHVGASSSESFFQECRQSVDHFPIASVQDVEVEGPDPLVPQLVDLISDVVHQTVHERTLIHTRDPIC